MPGQAKTDSVMTAPPRSVPIWSPITVSTGIAPQTAVGATAEVNLARQRLRLGKTRALLMVESAKGRSVQAGVIKVGGPFGLSIARAVERFYATRDSGSSNLDERLGSLTEVTVLVPLIQQ